MRKILAATVIASMMAAGSAFAASMPVLDVEQGQTQMNLEYMTGANINTDGQDAWQDNENGLAIAADYGINDDLALQVAHSRIQADGPDFKINEINGVYRVNENFNAFLGAMRASFDGEHETWMQLGAIGHMPLGEKVDGFAKLGFGTDDLRHVFQVGAKYQINDQFDAHAYYEHNKFNFFDDDMKSGQKGYYFGVGYKF